MAVRPPLMTPTVTVVDEDCYLIRETQYIEHCNCYLLVGGTACALIDTGVGLIDWPPLLKPLIQDKPLMVFLTHFHFDHIGGAGHFPFVHAMAFPEGKDLALNFMYEKDFYQKEDYLYVKDLFAHWQPPRIVPFQDGQKWELGGKTLTCHFAPGHDSTSVYLHCKEKKMLFSGDILYDGELFLDFEDSNQHQYLKSLSLIESHHPEILCGGHNGVIRGDEIGELLLNIRKHL